MVSNTKIEEILAALEIEKEIIGSTVAALKAYFGTDADLPVEIEKSTPVRIYTILNRFGFKLKKCKKLQKTCAGELVNKK